MPTASVVKPPKKLISFVRKKYFFVQKIFFFVQIYLTPRPFFPYTSRGIFRKLFRKCSQTAAISIFQSDRYEPSNIRFCFKQKTEQNIPRYIFWI